MKIIKVNKIRCKKCGDILESTNYGNLKFCKCGAVAIDGGHNFLKRIAVYDEDDIEELSEYEIDVQHANRESVNYDIDFIFNELVQVHKCIVFYHQMKDIKETYPDKYQSGKNFLNSVSIAYDYLIITILSKIFDRNGKKASLRLVIDTCEKYNLISEEKSKEYISRLETYGDIIKTIQTFRHKYFAHTDKQCVQIINNLIKDKKFNIHKFDELVISTIELLSNIKSEINNETYIFAPDMLSKYDLYTLLEIKY